MGRSIDGEFCNISVVNYSLPMPYFFSKFQCSVIFYSDVIPNVIPNLYHSFFECVTQNEIFGKMLFWTLLTFMGS